MHFNARRAPRVLGTQAAQPCLGAREPALKRTRNSSQLNYVLQVICSRNTDILVKLFTIPFFPPFLKISD